jgi:hypothetical protein
LDSGDNITTQILFGSQNLEQIKRYAEGYQLIAIDEAQRIPNIGFGLKLLIDHCRGIYVIATGSSSFRLSQGTGEPLTGRKKNIVLYPLSQMELNAHYNRYELSEQLENYLRFGTYPEVLTAKTQKEKIFILSELTDSYLLKDVLEIERIKASNRLVQLLKLLAFQIGSEVSLNELSSQVGLDVKTVGRYLDILEKGFVIKKISGFSRNLRNEITSKAKYYFLDTGIRNAVINQFNPLSDRNDTGVLFENFVFMERLKYNTYKFRLPELYFWRTHQGEEIDMIEDNKGKLHAIEIKWSAKRKPMSPPSWQKNYRGSKYHIITKENYLDYLL